MPSMAVSRPISQPALLEEIEEERRLTRAKKQLDLMVPQRFYVHQQPSRGDRHLYASRTRFVPDTILPLFELRTWPNREQESNLAASGDRKFRSTSGRGCAQCGDN
jgi:superfamily I DNA/RNA helicase